MKLHINAFDEAELVVPPAALRPPEMGEGEWRYRQLIQQAEDFELLSPFRQIEAAAEREAGAESEKKRVDGWAGL